MTDPLSLDTIQSEFSEESEAWVLQDTKSKKYVTIPHPKYPGRNPNGTNLSMSQYAVAVVSGAVPSGGNAVP